ncbi:MAG: response regulator [Planctomycetota bacterium]
MKILIADDNAQNCELLEAYLAEGDYDVRCVSDGTAAIEAVRADAPDVLLLDIMMPRMSGYEVCQQLRADEATAGLPIVMVSALDESGDIDKALEAGCDDFLTKPINGRELRIRVDALIALKAERDPAERLLGYVDRVEAAAEACRS